MRREFAISATLFLLVSAAPAAVGTPDAPSMSAMAALREKGQRAIEAEREAQRRAAEARKREERRKMEARARSATRGKPVEDPAAIMGRMTSVPPLLPPPAPEKKSVGLFEAIGHLFGFGKKEKAEELPPPPVYSIEIGRQMTREQAEFLCRDRGMRLGTKRDYYTLYTKAPGYIDPNYTYWTSEKVYRGRGVMFSVPNPVQKRYFFLAPVSAKGMAKCFSPGR